MRKRKTVAPFTEVKEFTGTYTTDYDITIIDATIKNKLHREHHEKITQLTQYRNYLYQRLFAPGSPGEHEIIKNRIKGVRLRLVAYHNDDYLSQYLADTATLLRDYQQLKQQVNTEYMAAAYQEQNTVFTDVTKQKLALIHQYLEIAGRYITIKLYHHHDTHPHLCGYCGTKLDLPGEDRLLRCNKCHNEFPSLTSPPMCKDLTGSFHDDSRENFIKIIKRFVGQQQPKPPDYIYEILDDHCLAKGLPLGAEVRELPLTAEGKRGDTTVTMLLDMLKELNLGYYDDVYYIGHHYWGWSYPDLFDCYVLMLIIYDKTQLAFRMLSDEERGRDSAILGSVRLWRILQLCGHYYPMDEFKMPEPDSFHEVDRVWKLMCERSNDERIYYIPI